MVEEKKKEEQLYSTCSRYIVYRDINFPTNWITYQNSQKIVDYLTSLNRMKRFIELNASDLRRWMDRIVKERDCLNTVVVFSQDVIPNTVYYDKSDPLIREYLNLGGRVVWIGDIPFAIYGKKGGSEPRINDPYAFLGSFPAFAFSDTKVEFSNIGYDWGLQNHKWYSMRPVHPRYIAPLWPPFNRSRHILAISILRNPMRRKDVYPQEMKGFDTSDVASLKSASDFIQSFFSIPKLIAAFFTILYYGILVINPLNIKFEPLLSISYLSLPLGFILLYWGLTRTKAFASSWIKKFKNDGEFIRIWDYRPEDIPKPMTEDLYRVATKNL